MIDGTMLLSAPLPVLDRVAASAVEVVPLGAMGKARDEVSVAAVTVPVPVNAEVCGELASLSDTESVAVKLVAEDGEKVT